MKKIILLFIISSLFLIGCTTIAEGDTSKITLGMSKDNVTEILGRPDETTTDRNDLSTDYDNISTMHAVRLEFDETEDEYVAYGRLREISDAIDEERNVELFDYHVKDDYRTIVYFIDNEVVHFYELDLSTE